MDGLALANLLRRTRPGLKLIIASGICRTLGSGIAEAFIHKPYDLPIVVSQIKALLASVEMSPSDPRLESPAITETISSLKTRFRSNGDFRVPADCGTR